nr:RNA-directed DNA polymerase, eukaryota, reverse transcriptase zinc-binding domain protein [Tanacetum cinerariifolium]
MIDLFTLIYEFSHIRKSILKAEFADLDGVIDKGEVSDADGHRRREVVRLIQEVEKVDAMEVTQKAKIKWSIEGDKNSKYYHGVLNKKRGRLTSRGVLVDGIWMESPHLVKHEFFEHFKNRFEKPNESCILLEMDFVKRISLEHNDDLEREVSNEENKRAVPNANMVTDFRPISLIGSLYNVIAKVLANHLVTVLDDIVDEIQSAFVMDRQILDSPFILNEIVYWCKNKKKQSMIFKVDIEKAYDSVRCDFIDDILRSNKVKHAAAKIGCLVLKMPFNYLGSRVGDLMSRIQSWHDVTEGMHTRLSKWKLKTLSIGGRLTLLKSDLGAISIYHMSIFKVPIKVLQNIEYIRARFFNGADVNSKKLNWVRWKSVLAAKDVGDLGVSSLFALNRALMFKWVWRFFSQKNSLWVRVVKALHEEYGKLVRRSNVAWCGDIVFKNLVPRLYALESMKNIKVASKLSHGGLEFYFRRNPRGGVEQAQFERLKEMVEGVTLSNSNDRWSWSLVGSGDFSVSPVRRLIDNAILPKGISKTRWIKEQRPVIMADGKGTLSTPKMMRIYHFFLRNLPWALVLVPPFVLVNTEPLKVDEELVIQPAEVTTDYRESLKPELFVVHPGSVAAQIKDMKCLPDVFELKDANACHLKISTITPPGWKNHLDNHMDVDLLDLHDRCYPRQVVVDNVVNKRSRELLHVIEKLSGEFDVIKDGERARKEECEEPQAKCEAIMTEFEKNPTVVALREKISTLSTKVKEHKVSLDILMLESQKLMSSLILYGRCKAYEQVADMKEPFDLSNVKGYRFSYKKDHTQARNDLATATFPWLDEFVADPPALIEALLSKKHPFLQRHTPSRT